MRGAFENRYRHRLYFSLDWVEEPSLHSVHARKEVLQLQKIEPREVADA
jgi:hypothetical protein